MESTFVKKLRVRLLGMHSPRAWLACAAVFLLLAVVVPGLNAWTSADSPLHVPEYIITVAGKFLCYAIVALAIDMIWGFTGILSLGHGVFFALGGYAIGMYMIRATAGAGVYRSELPDFTVFLDRKALPWFRPGFDNSSLALYVPLFMP